VPARSSAGALILGSQAEYDYTWQDTYLGETLTTAASMQKSPLFGADITLGVMVTENIEIYAGYGMGSKALTGQTGFTIPGIFYYNDEATATSDTEFKLTQNTINIGVAYHFQTNSPVEPYVGGGLTILNATLEKPTLLNFTDEYTGTWYSYWWITWFEEDAHNVYIDSITIEEEKINKTAFHLKLGVLAAISDRLAFFLEGRYILGANATMDIALSAESSGEAEIGNITWTDNRLFDADPETVDLNLGGLVGIAGIRLTF